MFSNSRMTHSKGPAEELSLPPTRMRKDVPTANEGKENAPEVQANVQSQQRTADTSSPLLDQGHGQAPAPRPPVKQECCQQPAVCLHGLTATQVLRHRSLHHHSHHYHLRATIRCRRTRTHQLVGT